MQNQTTNLTQQAARNRALIIAADQHVQTTSINTLQHAHWQVEAYANFAPVQSLPDKSKWPLVFVADDGRNLSEQVLTSFQEDILSERTYVIVLALQPSLTQVVRCTKLNAFEYLSPPLEPTRLLALSSKVRKLTDFKASAAFTTESVTVPEANSIPLIGQSAVMIELMKQVVKLAPQHDLHLFLAGETGTGKELIARQIHELSGRTGPFLAVNCAATVEALLESELFGHEKGAFTGALTAKKGLWEAAENGTLFLDEITEAAPSVQAKLLRVLQEGVLRHVGSNHETKVNARIISASNRNLEKAVQQGTLREDLYYRLGQAVLKVPPLRERLEDIPLLAETFCRRITSNCAIAPEAMRVLCSWSWPGNVRELESVIRRLASTAGSVILPEHLQPYIQPLARIPSLQALPFLSALPAINPERYPSMDEVQNWYATTLHLQGHKNSVIARILGRDVRTVARSLQEYEDEHPLPTVE